MQGYLLYRSVEGELLRIEAERVSRRVLMRVLLEGIPESGHVLGIVFGPRPAGHLKPAAA
jgi:hypothetical protein